MPKFYQKSELIVNNLPSARIRWACRRGMLELDLMLVPFFDERYHHLSEQGQETFERLLSSTDPELFSWLMGYENSNDPTLQEMINQIRQHAYPRS